MSKRESADSRTHKAAQKILEDLFDACESACKENEFIVPDFNSCVISQLLATVLNVAEEDSPKETDRILRLISRMTSHYVEDHGLVLSVQVLRKDDSQERT